MPRQDNTSEATVRMRLAPAGNRQRQAYAFAGGAVLLWSTTPSAFKLALRYVDPLQLVLYANATSIVVLFAILALQRRLRLLRRYTRADLLRVAGLGVLNPFLYYIVLFKAYDLLPAEQTAPLTFSWAVPLALLSVPLLGQRIGIKSFIALLISYVGVLVISTEGHVLALRFTSLPGVALALASTVIWALCWIYRTKDRGDPVAGLLVSFCVSLPLIVAATAVFSQLTTPHWQGVAGAVYAGVFVMGITYVCWLAALKRSETTAKVGNLIFLSPFGALVCIHFLVGESIPMATIIRLVLIVAGNLVEQWRAKGHGQT
jgi:drug/metabolite transporter (DMT)-like permease